MGTRGAVGFKIGDQLKVTYNHFDSYPDGLGKDVVAFCRQVGKLSGWEKLKELVKAVKMVEEDVKPSKALQKRYKKFSDTNVSEQTLEEWYVLLRKCQMAGGLKAIYAGQVSHMIESAKFLKDSLFCEYAYIIDLDNMKLMFFEGFNKTPDDNSPLPFPQEDCYKDEPDYPNKKAYYPVRFVGSCSLNKIPRNWKQKFYPEEDEDGQ